MLDAQTPEPSSCNRTWPGPGSGRETVRTAATRGASMTLARTTRPLTGVRHAGSSPASRRALRGSRRLRSCIARQRGGEQTLALLAADFAQPVVEPADAFRTRDARPPSGRLLELASVR